LFVWLPLVMVVMMSNEKYGKHDHDHDHHHHHHHQGQPNKKKGDDDVSERDRKGCAPACSNADEFLPIVDDCRLPEGGVLEFSYTFRKGFIGNAGKGGRCVYGKLASNGKVECRLESIDDTVWVRLTILPTAEVLSVEMLVLVIAVPVELLPYTLM